MSISLFCCLFLKLKLILFYNRVVYYYTRIFLILLLHHIHIYIYIYRERERASKAEENKTASPWICVTIPLRGIVVKLWFLCDDISVRVTKYRSHPYGGTIKPTTKGEGKEIHIFPTGINPKGNETAWRVRTRSIQCHSPTHAP